MTSMKQYIPQLYPKQIKYDKSTKSIQNSNFAIQKNSVPHQDSDRQQRQSSIGSQFQRYQLKQQNRISKTIEHQKRQNAYQLKKIVNKQQTNVHNTIQNQNNSILNQNNSVINQNNISQTYKDWKIYKNKSDINMLPFPYCFQQSFQHRKSPYPALSPYNLNRIKPSQVRQIKQKPKFISPLYKLKVGNKIQTYNSGIKQNKVYKPYFNYQKTPINQYLNFDLSEQINMGLRQVQVVAEQIKRIKKNKKIQNQHVQDAKQNKAIRIRKSFVKNYRGLYKSDADLTKC